MSCIRAHRLEGGKEEESTSNSTSCSEVNVRIESRRLEPIPEEREREEEEDHQFEGPVPFILVHPPQEDQRGPFAYDSEDEDESNSFYDDDEDSQFGEEGDYCCEEVYEADEDEDEEIAPIVVRHTPFTVWRDPELVPQRSNSGAPAVHTTNGVSDGDNAGEVEVHIPMVVLTPPGEDDTLPIALFSPGEKDIDDDDDDEQEKGGIVDLFFPSRPSGTSVLVSSERTLMTRAEGRQEEVLDVVKCVAFFIMVSVLLLCCKEHVGWMGGSLALLVGALLSMVV